MGTCYSKNSQSLRRNKGKRVNNLITNNDCMLQAANQQLMCSVTVNCCQQHYNTGSLTRTPGDILKAEGLVEREP